MSNNFFVVLFVLSFGLALISPPADPLPLSKRLEVLTDKCLLFSSDSCVNTGNRYAP